MMMRLMASVEAGMPIEEDLMLDLWLQTSLSTTFDAVLLEPVPDELLTILSVNLDT